MAAAGATAEEVVVMEGILVALMGLAGIGGGIAGAFLRRLLDGHDARRTWTSRRAGPEGHGK
jgi:hypothetical protein